MVDYPVGLEGDEMSTEDCYRCGKPLPGYFRLLCDECRQERTRQEAEENNEDDLLDVDDQEWISEGPEPGSYEGWQDDWIY